MEILLGQCWLRCGKLCSELGAWSKNSMGLYKACERNIQVENLSKDELVWWEKGDPLTEKFWSVFIQVCQGLDEGQG